MKNITKHRKNTATFLVVVFLTFSHWGCKKFLEVSFPSTSTSADLVFANDDSAISALTGIYTIMSQKGIGTGTTSIPLFAGLSSDELMLNTGVTSIDQLAFYKNELSNATPSVNAIWADSYYFIYMTNSIIAGLNSSNTLTPLIKQRLIGEAKFIRAFCYFYLVNLYGDVPLVLTPDYRINSNIGRTDKQKVYDQIVLDLKEAQNSLDNNYLDIKRTVSSQERTTPNKWVATALLARTYLYLRNFQDAELQASSVINNSALYDLAPLNGVFLKNSKEAIWQIQPVSDAITNTTDARLFILPAAGPNATSFPVYLFKGFDALYEVGDNRKSSWLGSVTVGGNTFFYPNKYKVKAFFAPSTEYPTVLRLAELYLIRAEARAQQGKLTEARDDINKIRSRSGASLLSVTSQSEILSAILIERRKEFFTEWGHRWLDLKRTENINGIMTSVILQKGGTWQPFKQLYPIPKGEFELNPGLAGQQNQGYN